MQESKYAVLSIQDVVFTTYNTKINYPSLIM